MIIEWADRGLFRGQTFCEAHREPVITIRDPQQRLFRQLQRLHLIGHSAHIHRAIVPVNGIVEEREMVGRHN
jgi:hypothetical protein